MNVLEVILLVLVVAAIALSLAVLFQWMVQFRAVRRAGVNVHSPGCIKCLYIVRGWNSSTCPECGTDVLAHGVVIGPRVSRWLTVSAVLILMLAIGLPMCLLTAETVFVSLSHYGAWQFSSAGTASLDIHASTGRDVWTVWGSPRYTTRIVLAKPNTFDGLMIAYEGDDELPWVGARTIAAKDDALLARLEIGPDDAIPAAERFETFLTSASGDEITLAIRRQATALRDLVVASRSGPQQTANFAPNPGVFSNISSGYGNSRRLIAEAKIGMFVVPALIALVVALIVFRRHRPGIRAAVDGEWLAASPRQGTALPQISQI